MYPSPLSDGRNINYKSPLPNDLYRKSYYPIPERLSNDDEQIVKSDLIYDIKSSIRRQSTNSISSSSSFNMQQQTTNSISDDSNNGVTNRSCSVCGDVSTGIHFGGNSCESCKAFFRRSVQCNRYQNYKCSNEARCPVNIVTRKVCQFCRYTKCTSIGMKPKWVLSDQEREEKYGSRRKRFRENRTSEEDPDIYKYLSQDDKQLIEDIAHAFYQSRATYPLQFLNNISEYLNPPSPSSSLDTMPPPPLSTTEKPPSPSANFLIVPIKRLVLFARMLPDFNSFSEDDKVNLLKGSAIEIVVCSASTLFNPKTQTFSNYLSRDQRVTIDNQALPLDPLLKRLWGEDLFNATKAFLISMHNLQIDEVSTTLLLPVLLFSPDRSNIVNISLVKLLQAKYVTLLQKYMFWRYGIEHTEKVFPKLLLQIIKIRTLSLAQAEIIQKLMSASSVNPLVQEVTAKPELLTKTTSEKLNSLSKTSNLQDHDMADAEKIRSVDAESNTCSDEDDTDRKKSPISLNEEANLESSDSNEAHIRNIWKKRRKYSSTMQADIANVKQSNVTDASNSSRREIKQDLTSPTSNEHEKYSNPTHTHKRPHDHQVPNSILKSQNDFTSTDRTTFRHLPLKKQSLAINRDNPQEQAHLSYSPSVNDYSSTEHFSSCNQSSNTVTSTQGYPPPSYDNYHQQFNRMLLSDGQQQFNEHNPVHLSLVNNRSQVPSIQLSTSHTSPPSTNLDPDEQQLLDAIHAHPNKRDLVLSLLRQMNDPSFIPPADYPPTSNRYCRQ